MWLQLTILALGVATVTGQDTIGCFVPGECLGSLIIGVKPSPSQEDCLYQCQGEFGCQFFTYYDDIKACSFMASCDTLNATTCTGCLSGEVECEPPNCNIVGMCDGRLVDFDSTDTQQECIDSCDLYDNCQTWNYDTVNLFCILVEGCAFVDTSYVNYLHGERGCHAVPDEPEPAAGVPKLVIVGGKAFNNQSQEVLLMDVNGTETVCPGVEDFPVEIINHGALNIKENILVCGGEVDGESQSGCWKVESKTTWLADANMTVARSGFAGFTWNDDSVWVTGGSDENNILQSSTDEYNGTIFTSGPLLPSVLESHCIVKATENFLVVAGGSDGQDDHRRNAMLYQVDTDSWSFLPPMTDGRAGHVCEVVSSSRGQEIIVAGGGTDLTSVDVFSFTSQSWRIGPSLPKPMVRASSVAYEGTLLLIGGTDDEGEFYDTVYEYKVEEQEWDERLDMKLPSGRYGHASIIMDADDLGCTII